MITLHIWLVIISEFCGCVLCFGHGSSLHIGCYTATNLEFFSFQEKDNIA